MDTLSDMLSSGNILQQVFDDLTYLLSTSFFDLNLNRSRMSVYTAQANFALSRKNLAHLVQFIVYDEFAKFDYGPAGNQLVYGREDPPEYDLRCITNRSVALIYSKNDEWASVSDFESIGSTMKGKWQGHFTDDESLWVSHCLFQRKNLSNSWKVEGVKCFFSWRVRLKN